MYRNILSGISRLSNKPLYLCNHKAIGCSPCIFNIHTTSKVLTTPGTGQEGTPRINIPDFTDTKSIYASKTAGELFRAYFVFSLCSIDVLVNNQLKILQWTQKLLGRTVFRSLMRRTIYGQFMAGETAEEVTSVAKKNAKAGLYSMFSYTAGESHGDAKGSEKLSSQQDVFKNNEEALNICTDIASACKDISNLVPQMATKITYFTASQTLFKLNEVLVQQESLLESILNDCDDANKKAIDDTLKKIIAKSKAQYGSTCLVQPHQANDVYLPSLTTNIPFTMTLNQHIKELQQFTKKDLDNLVTFTKEDEKNICDVYETMDRIGKRAHDAGVVLIWDAEQTYLQRAIEVLILDNMRAYNKDRPAIHGTYQCYLKKTYDTVVYDLELAQREGFCLGLKVVRGAYMDEERRRALDNNYEDPVNPTYDATTAMYEKVAGRLLEVARDHPKNIHVTFATHNEDTVTNVLNMVNETGFEMSNNNVGFAQLLGMRDHISLALALSGAPVAKLIHYGVIEEGVAYLSRRLLENRSGMPTADVEKRYLRTALRMRITGRSN